jgi:hypothetical protein
VKQQYWFLSRYLDKMGKTRPNKAHKVFKGGTAIRSWNSNKNGWGFMAGDGFLRP